MRNDPSGWEVGVEEGTVTGGNASKCYACKIVRV